MPSVLQDIPKAFAAGEHLGITSVCSAHPIVVEAALQLGKELNKSVLIEATCNQVNQDGGYTGMTPADFRTFVESIAKRVGFDVDQLILGGDHLGPNPWTYLDAAEAMDKAEVMITAFAKAGFTKLHLDTSMGCAGEPEALADELTAERAARLASAAEANTGDVAPAYIIGTEVPVPGGATHELDVLELTTPEAAARTYEVHKQAFEAAGLDDALSRVIGLVVQPGVEFGHSDVIHFEEAKATALTGSLSTLPNLVFEAHSTDYQTDDGLRALVANGFAILKVGPWLTFALREAMYALDGVADVLEGRAPQGGLMSKMEAVMQASPGNWQKYYSGDETEVWLQRHFSLSDRIRYYWPDPKAQEAVEELHDRLSDKTIPDPVLRQFLPSHSATDGATDCHSLLVGAVKEVLKSYDYAVSR